MSKKHISQTLKERGERYGSFKENAVVSQALKAVMRGSKNWSTMSADQREALEMVAHKIARILNGDPNYGDSWHDISGYAKLVEDEIVLLKEINDD